VSPEDLFAAAGCTGTVHATTPDGTHEVGWPADEPVVPASVVKVLIALEAETQLADGRLHPGREVRLRADGPWSHRG
jgi:beta-lactamase class A